MASRKNTKYIVLAASLALMSMFAQATEPGRWERMKSYAHTEKVKAVEDAKHLMNETDAKIAELKKQSQQTMDKAKAAHAENMKTMKANNDQHMKELQAKKAQAQAHLAKLQKSSGDAWDATKDGFANAYQDLHRSYEKAAGSFKQ